MRNILLGFVMGVVLTSVAAWAELNLDPRIPNKQKNQLDRIEQQNNQILKNQKNPC